MDVSPFLSPDKAYYYQTIIGVMRWMVKLGHVDIAVKVSQISSLLSIAHKGYMLSYLHIMSYLRIKHNCFLVFDKSYADINLSGFKSYKKWTAFYGNAKEANIIILLNLLVRKLSSEYLLILTIPRKDKSSFLYLLYDIYEYIHDILPYEKTSHFRGHFFWR